MDPDARPQTFPSEYDAGDFEEQEFLKHFVEQYLTSRGYRFSSRNARLVVAALADCRPDTRDVALLQQCVEKAVDHELLHRAA